MSQQLEKVKELIELREKARMGGGQKGIDSQHAKGKYNESTCSSTRAASKNSTCS